MTRLPSRADHSAQTTIELGPEIPGRRIGCGRERPHHDEAAVGQTPDAFAHQVPQAPLHAVAGHGRTHGFRHDEAHPTRVVPVGSPGRWFDMCGGQVHDHERTTRTATPSHREPEVSGGAQAMAGGQQPVASPQTARLLRPLRRRADRIARPARVRIRRRKPCTL